MRTLKIFSFGNFQIGNTLLLTIVTMLYIISLQSSSVAQLWLTLCDPMDCSAPGYIISLWVIYFVPRCCTFWPDSPISSIPYAYFWQPPLFSLCLWACFFFLVVVVCCCSHKWDQTVFVFLCLTYFTEHNALRSVYIVANGKISFLFMAK